MGRRFARSDERPYAGIRADPGLHRRTSASAGGVNQGDVTVEHSSGRRNELRGRSRGLQDRWEVRGSEANVIRAGRIAGSRWASRLR
jgi:hypothetical protein